VTRSRDVAVVAMRDRVRVFPSCNWSNWLRNVGLAPNILVAILLLTACAKPAPQVHSSELGSLEQQDMGLIVGSINISSPPVTETDSFFRLARPYDYVYHFSLNIDPSEDRYFIQASYGTKKYFAIKLTEGLYKFDHVSFVPVDSMSTSSLDITFDDMFLCVWKGRITYIGDLDLHVPDKINLLESVTLTVWDNGNETVQVVADQHALVLTNVVRRLLTNKETSTCGLPPKKGGNFARTHPFMDNEHLFLTAQDRRRIEQGVTLQ
jgi:hypothetical protein